VAIIRVAREADARTMLAIYAPYVRDTAISFELEPPTEEEFQQRMRSTLQVGLWLACEAGSTLLGYAYAGRFHARPAYQWTVEVTVYVHRDHHRQGVGIGLYTALLDCLTLQGFHNAVGIIALPNPASVALHERLGFSPAVALHGVGYKHGVWHDVGWWERTLSQRPLSPEPPRPLTAVQGSAPWRHALDRGVGLVRA